MHWNVDGARSEEGEGEWKEEREFHNNNQINKYNGDWGNEKQGEMRRGEGGSGKGLQDE